MFFIGIITNQKNEDYIISKLSRIYDKNIIFITDKNISNVKNIKFDTILIDTKVNDVTNLKKIIKNTKYVILNSDFDMDKSILENMNLNIITYGFNNKCTFTVSSITENNIIICLQRNIINSKGQKCEPQEFEIENNEKNEVHAIIGTHIIEMIYTI